MHNARRQFLKYSLTGLIGATFGLSHSSLAQAVRLRPDDPLARAMGYIQDSPHPDKRCDNCRHKASGGDATWQACNTFLGKLVKTSGWCHGWKKS